MRKTKYRWQVLSLILVLLSASCLLVNTPADNQNTLETVVAATLTSIAGDVPIETSPPGNSDPAGTIAPEVPTFTPSRALQVAYIKDGNVYIWTEGESSVGLTSTHDAVDVSISDDGQIIAYTRRDPTNDYAYELWAVNTSGLTNARLLVSNAEFEALKAASPYPDAEGLLPEKIDWKPKTHLLAYSTVPMFMGPGYAPNKDLRLIDVDTLEKSTLFDFDQGGLFFYAPDGSQVALVNPDHIGFANADGTNMRASVLTFSHVITYSEYQYYPHPYWTADSSALRVVIPPADPLATPLEATTLWHIPTDGSPPSQLSSIPAIPFAWPDTAFSPDLDKVSYAKSIGEPEQNQRELHIANADGSGDMVFDSGEGLEFWLWTPGGTRFVYAINGGAEQGAYLGQLSGGTTLIASIPSSVQQMRWVDPSRFLYFNPNGNILELRISDVDGTNHAFIDSIANSFTNYDFTQ